jgi:hypothetical protein
MALLWCDGFEGYGPSGVPTPTDVLADKYDFVGHEVKIDIVTTNSHTDRSLRTSDLSTSWVTSFRTPSITSGNTVICGVGFWFPYAGSFDYASYWSLFVFYNDSGNICAIVDTTDTGISVRDAAGNTIGGTRCLMLYQDWCYVEAKVYSHATAGTVDIRLNGCSVFSASSVNTLNTGGAITKVMLGTSETDLDRKSSSLLDNFYVCDGAGAANNDFLGPVTVRTLFPDGDDIVQFAVTGNANYSTHFEQMNDNYESYPTTDYVEDGTTGNRDIYTLDNSVDNFATVYGVIGWGYAKYIGGAINYRLVASSNGTENESSNIAASSDWHYDRHVLETDPDTSNAWTDSTINALKFGFEVQ